MSEDHQRSPRFSRAIALTLCLLSCCAILAESQDAIPSEHGLMYEKSPGEASPAMIAFFSQPKVELPEAQNISHPAVRRDPQRGLPTEGVPNNDMKKIKKPAPVVIASVVFAVLVAGLLAAAVMAYVLHARRSKICNGSSSMVGLTRWRNESEVQLGAV